MKKTKIQPIKKSKTIDYSNKTIENFWLEINETPSFKEKNNIKQITDIFNDIQDSVICIQTKELNHPDIVKAIFNATKKRNRIYLLTNEKDTSLKLLEGVSLIRYGINNIGSFILVNPNTKSSKGVIYSNSLNKDNFSNPDNITLDLDNKQIKSLFRFFSDNFWNKATHEIINSFESPKEVGEPPLDFLPNMEDFCDEDYVKKEILKIKSEAIVSVPHIQNTNLLDFLVLKNSSILTSLKSNDNKFLTSLATKNDIYAVANNDKRVLIAKNNNWLIPNSNETERENFFALKLNNKQIDLLKENISDTIENASFKYHVSQTRKQLDNKNILFPNNIDNVITIKSETQVNANTIELNEFISKDQFTNQEPTFTDDNISVKIAYHWEINPFYTPNNTKKAKLYSDWEKYQNEYNAFLKQIDKLINESNNINIGEHLKRWFLGKKQVISKQQDELKVLETKNLAILEIPKRKEVIKRINQLTKDVSVSLDEINIEIQKSDIKKRIEKLKLQLKNKNNELIEFIKKQEQELTEKETNKEELLTNFLEKHKIKKEELPTHKSEWQRKKNKKKEKIATDKEKLAELNNIEGFIFRRKFEDEKQKIEKQIKKTATDIKSEEQSIEKLTTTKVSNNSSLNLALGKTQKQNTNIENLFSIPDSLDYLPKTGELYEVGKQKYLEIEFWEDYKLGQEEIERFNAKLSVKNS